MAAKVKWKECYLFLVFYVIYVNGMFVHRHCSHVHPKPDEVRKEHVIIRASSDTEIFYLEPVTFRKQIAGYSWLAHVAQHAFILCYWLLIRRQYIL